MSAHNERRKLIFWGVAAVGVVSVCAYQWLGARPTGPKGQAKVLPRLEESRLPAPETLRRDPFARNLLVGQVPVGLVGGRGALPPPPSGLSGRIAYAAVAPMPVQVPVVPPAPEVQGETKTVLLRAVMGSVDQPVAYLQIADQPAAPFSAGDIVVPGTILESIDGGAVRLRTARKVQTVEVGQQVKL